MNIWTNLLSIVALVALACASPKTPPGPETEPTSAPATPEVQPVFAGPVPPSDHPPEVPPADDDAPRWIDQAGQVDHGNLPNGGGFEPGLRPLTPPTETEIKVTLGQPTIVGTLDHARIAMVIRRYSPGLKWCYTKRLESVPTLAGELTLTFEVLGDGTTQGPSVSQRTLDDAWLEACVLTKVARWRFLEEPRGSAKVTVTVGMRSEIPAAK